MSYGRNPHYIYSDGENLCFVPHVDVPEYLINAFLYKLLLKNRRDELKERLIQGKNEWMTETHFNRKTMKSEESPADPEYVEWMNEQEDELLRILMG